MTFHERSGHSAAMIYGDFCNTYPDSGNKIRQKPSDRSGTFRAAVDSVCTVYHRSATASAAAMVLVLAVLPVLAIYSQTPVRVAGLRGDG